jgi:hypothetical protein
MPHPSVRGFPTQTTAGVPSDSPFVHWTGGKIVERPLNSAVSVVCRERERGDESDDDHGREAEALANINFLRLRLRAPELGGQRVASLSCSSFRNR